MLPHHGSNIDCWINGDAPLECNTSNNKHLKKKKKKQRKDSNSRLPEQRLKELGDILFFLCPFWRGTDPVSLISTQEISLERRWEDKRPQKASVNGERGREEDERKDKEENGGTEGQRRR